MNDYAYLTPLLYQFNINKSHRRLPFWILRWLLFVSFGLVDGHGVAGLAQEDDEAAFWEVDLFSCTCVVGGVDDLEELVVDVDV